MDKDLLYRFFEGEASIEEMGAVKEWAESSEEHNKQLHRERKLFNAMILVGNPKWTAINATRGRSYFIREFLKIASVVIIAVSITAGIFSITSDRNSDINMAMQTITVPAGQRVNIELPDGSNVWLNAGTKMQYPVSFMKDKREITLDGEAYFDVAHNERCPFVVHTHAMDIEVLGTKFNVEAYAKQQNFEASLLQGKIKIKSPLDDKISQILLPNYKSTLKNGKLVTSKIEDYNEYRWKEGLYCFKNKSFIEIIKKLERYYNLKIVVNKPNITKIELTGKFRISDGLDYALRVLQKDIPFICNKNTENDTIYIQ